MRIVHENVDEKYKALWLFAILEPVWFVSDESFLNSVCLYFHVYSRFLGSMVLRRVVKRIFLRQWDGLYSANFTHRFPKTVVSGFVVRPINI